MKPLRILQVADFLPGLHTVAGGAEHAALRAIETLAAAGVETFVATSPVSQGAPTPRWSGFHQIPSLDGALGRASFLVKQLWLPRDPRAARAFAGVLQHARPDVVHFHNLHTLSLSLPVVARRAGVPVLVSVYDYWFFCPSFMLVRSDGSLCLEGHGARCGACIGHRRPRPVQALAAGLFAFRDQAFRAPLAAVNRFHVLSEASGRLLARYGVAPERVTAIPQLLWAEAAGASRAQERGRFLYVGWIERRKGLHVALAGLARVAQRHPEARLVILGLSADAAYRKEVDRLIEAEGLTDRVLFRGKVDRSELLSELGRAHLVLVPEQWENMSPVIVTEAMSAGACLLASRVGGIPDFVEEGRTGLLAGRDDPSEWGKQMEAALADPGAAERMGQAARERARRLFDPDAAVRAHLELYRNLADARSA